MRLHTSASGSELSANPARWEEVAGGSGDSAASAASMEPVVIANIATMSSSGAPKSLSGNPNDHLSEKAIREAIARGGSGADGFAEDGFAEDSFAEDSFAEGLDNPMNKATEVRQMKAQTSSLLI